MECQESDYRAIRFSHRQAVQGVGKVPQGDKGSLKAALERLPGHLGSFRLRRLPALERVERSELECQPELGVSNAISIVDVAGIRL